MASCGGRLATACLGRPGTPPARHYDLAARSSLHGSGRQMPAVAWRRAPKETEARPRGPKPPRWSAERRASRVMIRLTGASHAPERFSALRPPLDFGVSEAKSQTPDANASRERDGLFDIVKWNDGERFRDEPQFATRSPVLILRSARAGAIPQTRTRVRASRRMRTSLRDASQRASAAESTCACVALRCSSA